MYNNDLKDGQNERLENEETLNRTRNWSGIYTKKPFIESYKHYTENNLKQQLEWKKFKTGIYNNTYHGPLS